MRGEMFNFCRFNIRNAYVRRFVAGVLSLVIISATLSDAIAHIGFDGDRHHSGSHHQQKIMEAERSSNLTNEAKDCFSVLAHYSNVHTHVDTHNKDYIPIEDNVPINDDCQFGCEGHICLTAILMGISKVVPHRINKNYIKHVPQHIRSIEMVELLRPPIYFL